MHRFEPRLPTVAQAVHGAFRARFARWGCRLRLLGPEPMAVKDNLLVLCNLPPEVHVLICAEENRGRVSVFANHFAVIPESSGDNGAVCKKHGHARVAAFNGFIERWMSPAPLPRRGENGRCCPCALAATFVAASMAIQCAGSRPQHVLPAQTAWGILRGDRPGLAG